MTENEAIRDLQYLIGEYSAYPPETGVNATVGSLQYCITALKEIQQYREIGTVEECREAVGKQKPNKIYHKKWNGIDGVPYDLCPTCKNNLCTTGMFARRKMNYCEKCGQKLCWDEN